jgi:uncharacterized OB-fold protein
MKLICLSMSGDFRPGDPAPPGYTQWMDWAKVQQRAGLRQRRCPVCGKYRYPQEACCREDVSAR